jgi:hypothetical protein
MRVFTIDQSVQYELPILLDQVIDITEDAAAMKGKL